MYIPAAFREDDPDRQQDLMQRNSFATLVTVGEDGLPFASHVPVLLDPSVGQSGVLRTHLARGNPQVGDLTAGVSALTIFQGPHAYISPNWYEKGPTPSVPTWNYAVVHAYGIPRCLDDAELRTLLAELSAVYEAGQPEPWRMEALPEDYITKMLRGIVGFEIALTRVEGKAKLSQNRSDGDRLGAIAGLRATVDPTDAATAALMEAYRTHE